MMVQILALASAHLLPVWSLIHWLPAFAGSAWWPAAAAGAASVFLLAFGRDAAFLRDGLPARTVYRLSMIDAVLFLNLFMASVIHLVLRLAITIGGWDIPGRYTLLVLYAVGFGSVAWGMLNARRLVVRKVIPDAAAFPPEWKGRRIVFFSDTHYGTLNGPGMAERLVRRIEGLSPHLIICGGDLFDGPRGRFEETLAVLSRLRAPLGVLAVLGNHDYFYLTSPGSSRELLGRQRSREEMPMGPGTRLHAVMSALPWRFLENEQVEIDGVRFVGLRPFTRGDETRARALLSSLDDSVPTVLINHKPDVFPETATSGVLLQLSGHTHGGPLFPVNLFMRRILRGRHHGTTMQGTMMLDVSSGSGLSLWYPRTVGRHEVVVVEPA